MKHYLRRPWEKIGACLESPARASQRFTGEHRHRYRADDRGTTARPLVNPTRALLRSQDASSGSCQIDDSLREDTQEND